MGESDGMRDGKGEGREKTKSNIIVEGYSLSSNQAYTSSGDLGSCLSYSPCRNTVVCVCVCVCVT